MGRRPPPEILRKRSLRSLDKLRKNRRRSWAVSIISPLLEKQHGMDSHPPYSPDGQRAEGRFQLWKRSHRLTTQRQFDDPPILNWIAAKLRTFSACVCGHGSRHLIVASTN